MTDWFRLVVLVAITCGVANAQSEPNVGADAGAAPPPHPRSFYENAAKGRLKMLTKAFELTEDQQAWLQEELQRRVAEAEEYDRETERIVREIRDGVATGRPYKHLTAELNRHIAEKDPLHIQNIIPALTPHVSAAQAEFGAKRAWERLNRNIEQKQAEYQKKIEAASAPRIPPPSKPLQPPAEPLTHKPRLEGKSAPSPQRILPTAAPQLPKSPPVSSVETKHPAAGRPAGPPSSPPQAAVQPPPADTLGKSKSYTMPKKGPLATKLGDWERIVAEYCARYELDSSQRATAQGILKDCQERAEAYRVYHRTEYERVRKIEDGKLKAAEREKLDAPLLGIESDLRQRLNQIPTAAQRAKGDAAKPDRRGK